MSHQAWLGFTQPFKTIYKGLVLWSWTAKHPVNRDALTHTHSNIQQCICKKKYWYFTKYTN